MSYINFWEGAAPEPPPLTGRHCANSSGMFFTVYLYRVGFGVGESGRARDMGAKGVAKGGGRWARPTPESFWPTPENQNPPVQSNDINKTKSSSGDISTTSTSDTSVAPDVRQEISCPAKPVSPLPSYSAAAKNHCYALDGSPRRGIWEAVSRGWGPFLMVVFVPPQCFSLREFSERSVIRLVMGHRTLNIDVDIETNIELYHRC
ncbi:hypothetical protein GEV33_006590 [Tenebrio molitor]|uniref:Uncharacterized protein n=1 Tax=Tenebrio molitor TaxID=7067 RepID=A0A8J6LJK6_TENMO|nr:hypothetical protein GEV33_006590 [Tenebrio molitor]